MLMIRIPSIQTWIVLVNGFSADFDGPWYVLSARHMITMGGYQVAMELGKDGFGTIPLSRSTGLTDKIPAPQLLNGRWVAGVFLIGCLGSCLTVRFAHRHEKDDYRSAAAVAKSAAASGQHVWWNAESLAADYYHVAGDDHVSVILNPRKGSLRNRPAPDLVIVSKPETYDPHGGMAEYLREGGYHLTQQLPPVDFWMKHR